MSKQNFVLIWSTCWKDMLKSAAGKNAKQDIAAKSISVLHGPHKVTQIDFSNKTKTGNNTSHAAFTQQTQQQQNRRSIAPTATHVGRMSVYIYLRYICIYLIKRIGTSLVGVNGWNRTYELSSHPTQTVMGDGSSSLGHRCLKNILLSHSRNLEKEEKTWPFCVKRWMPMVSLRLINELEINCVVSHHTYCIFPLKKCVFEETLDSIWSRNRR